MFSTGFAFLKNVSAGGGGLDPDAEAFLTATGITDPTITTAINDLVVDLKGASLWTKFYAIWPLVGGTATTTKYNLVDPQDTDAAFRLTWNGGWTFGPSGAQGNASNTYGNTHFVMSTDFANPQNLSMGHYTLDTPAQVQAYINTGFGTRSGFSTGWNYFNDLGINANIGVFDPYGEDYRVGVFTAVNSQGLNWVDKESAASNKIYKNSTLSASGTFDTSAAPIPTEPLFLAANNQEQYNGFPSFANPSGNTFAFAYIADSIGASNASALYTIIQDFQTTLGRQV
jgi:hypothetical protein